MLIFEQLEHILDTSEVKEIRSRRKIKKTATKVHTKNNEIMDQVALEMD
jgi:hypothetical protein